jgi:hypothetical protein
MAATEVEPARDAGRAEVEAAAARVIDAALLDAAGDTDPEDDTWAAEVIGRTAGRDETLLLGTALV